MPKRKGRPEELQQTALFEWAGLAAATMPELRWMFAVPNGGLRSKSEAARMKAAGVKAGVWDVFLPAPRGRYGGLWIEMKAGSNRLSDEQFEFGNAMVQQGYKVAVCYDWTQARQAVLDYMTGVEGHSLGLPH